MQKILLKSERNMFKYLIFSNGKKIYLKNIGRNHKDIQIVLSRKNVKLFCVIVLKQIKRQEHGKY